MRLEWCFHHGHFSCSPCLHHGGLVGFPYQAAEDLQTHQCFLLVHWIKPFVTSVPSNICKKTIVGPQWFSDQYKHFWFLLAHFSHWWAIISWTPPALLHLRLASFGNGSSASAHLSTPNELPRLLRLEGSMELQHQKTQAASGSVWVQSVIRVDIGGFYRSVPSTVEMCQACTNNHGPTAPARDSASIIC